MSDWNNFDYIEKQISVDEIEKLIIGSTFLGTGGGGDKYAAEDRGMYILKKLLRKEGTSDEYHTLTLVNLDNLTENDNDQVFISMLIGYANGALGIPENNKDDFYNVISTSTKNLIEEYGGDELKYVIPYEAGVFNLLYTFIIAAVAKKEFNRDLKIIDCDCAGKAIPKIYLTPLFLTEKNNITPIYCKCFYKDNKFYECPNNLLPGFNKDSLSEEYIDDFDNKIRNDIISKIEDYLDTDIQDEPYGGFCFCWKMNSNKLKIIKENFIFNTISKAVNIGILFDLYNTAKKEDLIDELKEKIKNLYDKQLVIIYEPKKSEKVSEYRKFKDSLIHFHYFHLPIPLELNEYNFWLKNEILFVSKQLSSGSLEYIAMAPDIISIIYNNIPMSIVDLVTELKILKIQGRFNQKEFENNIVIVGFAADQKIIDAYKDENKLKDKYVVEIKDAVLKICPPCVPDDLTDYIPIPMTKIEK